MGVSRREERHVMEEKKYKKWQILRNEKYADFDHQKERKLTPEEDTFQMEQMGEKGAPE